MRLNRISASLGLVVAVSSPDCGRSLLPPAHPAITFSRRFSSLAQRVGTISPWIAPPASSISAGKIISMP